MTSSGDRTSAQPTTNRCCLRRDVRTSIGGAFREPGRPRLCLPVPKAGVYICVCGDFRHSSKEEFRHSSRTGLHTGVGQRSSRENMRMSIFISLLLQFGHVESLSCAWFELAVKFTGYSWRESFFTIEFAPRLFLNLMSTIELMYRADSSVRKPNPLNTSRIFEF